MAIRSKKKAIFETPNRRMRKRRRAIRKLIVFFVLFLIVAAAVFFFFRIPALQVSQVTVIGAHEMDAQAVRDEASRLSEGTAALIIPRTFFLAYPRQEIEAALLANHKEISAAEAKLKGATYVEISITERSASAYYCLESCYIADGSGLVYEAASSTDGRIVFRDERAALASSSPIGTYPLPTDIFNAAKGFAAKLGDLKLHLKEIVIGENSDLSVMTEEGRLVISSREPLEPQYEFLKIALSQPAFSYPDGAIRSFNYIDLRFGKKVFYKLGFDAAPAASTSPALDL